MTLFYICPVCSKRSGKPDSHTHWYGENPVVVQFSVVVEKRTKDRAWKKKTKAWQDYQKVQLSLTNKP